MRGEVDLHEVEGHAGLAQRDVNGKRLWLLTHPESRHLRRIATVAAYLAENLAL